MTSRNFGQFLTPPPPPPSRVFITQALVMSSQIQLMNKFRISDKINLIWCFDLGLDPIYETAPAANISLYKSIYLASFYKVKSKLNPWSKR